jgi:hypothetical protein
VFTLVVSCAGDTVPTATKTSAIVVFCMLRIGGSFFVIKPLFPTFYLRLCQKKKSAWSLISNTLTLHPHEIPRIPHCFRTRSNTC